MNKIIKRSVRPLFKICYNSNYKLISVKSVDSRCIHRISNLYGKMFLEKENKYAYDILESKGYAKSLNINSKEIPLCVETYEGEPDLTKKQFDEIIKEQWSKQSPQYVFKHFPRLGKYSKLNNLSLTNTIFDSYIDSLTDNLKYASDEELKELFYSLNEWPEVESVKSRNYIEVWAALDDECVHRIKEWSYDKMLTFLSLFYMVNVVRYSDFSFKAIQKLANKPHKLSKSELIQTLFFIGVRRIQPPDSMHSLEIQVEKRFEEFSVDELTILSMGFFKSKTPLRNKDLVYKIMDKVMENSKTIHEISLAALLKIIRYSLKIVTNNKPYELLDVLQNEVPRLSVMCQVHIALLGLSTLTFHKQCLNNIAEHFITNIDKARVKDLERLILTYGTFNLRPGSKKDFFEAVIEELRFNRLEETFIYARSFACSVAYLGLSGEYPRDLIDRALSHDFLNKTYGKYCYNFGREILTLHNCAKLFFKDEHINLLSDKEAHLLAKKYTDYVPNEDFQKQYNFAEKMYIDIVKYIREDRGGEKFAVGDHVLTHYQRGDIIVCNKPDGEPASVEALNNIKFGLLKAPPDDNIWTVLVIAGRNGEIRGIGKPTGVFQTKVKQLNQLGYCAEVVLNSTYDSLQTPAQKLSYINNLIQNAINKKPQ